MILLSITLLTLKGHLKKCHFKSTGQFINVFKEMWSYKDGTVLFPLAIKPSEIFVYDQPDVGLNLKPVNFQNLKLCFHSLT